MSTPTPEQLGRLPAWAHKHITNLENQASSLRRALREVQSRHTPSPCWFTNNTLEFGDRFYIPTDKVTFDLGAEHDVSVEVQGNKLVITGIGFGGLKIIPHVNNQISVAIDE